jgi:ABC-type iron transport system FetAB permease component
MKKISFLRSTFQGLMLAFCLLLTTIAISPLQTTAAVTTTVSTKAVRYTEKIDPNREKSNWAAAMTHTTTSCYTITTNTTTLLLLPDVMLNQVTPVTQNVTASTLNGTLDQLSITTSDGQQSSCVIKSVKEPPAIQGASNNLSQIRKNKSTELARTTLAKLLKAPLQLQI